MLPESLLIDYRKHLEPFGVSPPSASQELGLTLLFLNQGQAVTQEDLTAFYLKNGQSYNKQLRHLASSGWYIASGNRRASSMVVDASLGRNALTLVSTVAPNPIWLRETRLKRTGRCGVVDWNEMLHLFSTRGCAVCGRKTEHYDKGHLDNTLPFELWNLAPMCVDCNNYAASRNISYSINDSTLVARPISMKNI